MDELETCVHCQDDIFLSERGFWVDVNALRSCAPIAEKHEPMKDFVQIAVSLPDGTLAHYTVHIEFWEKQIEPLISPETVRT